MYIYIYIYIPGKLGLLSFIILCCLMMCADDIVHYDPMVAFVCFQITPPHYHPYADLSESIELLKCLSGTFFLECVSKIKPIISIISYAIHGTVCIQLIHSLTMIVRICVLYLIIIIKSEEWPIYHCLGLGKKNNDMRCMYFYILITSPPSIAYTYQVLIKFYNFSSVFDALSFLDKMTTSLEVIFVTGKNQHSFMTSCMQARA